MIDDASGWVAAGAAVAAAIVVAWQSWETRRAAQASEAAVNTANEALTLAQQQAAEAVRARIDAATPAISVFLDPVVDWPPLEPSGFASGHPNPLTPGLNPESMHMPRDKDRQIMVRAGVRILNESDRTVQVDVHELLEMDGATPLSSPVTLEPGASVAAWCASTHTLSEWIEVHDAREKSEPGYSSDAVVATVHYSAPVDTGAIDRWDLVIGGAPVMRVDELDGAWRIIPEARPFSGAAGAIGTGAVFRQRRYFLSKLQNQEIK